MIKIARYNQEQKRFEIESTGCETMDELVDSCHEALHTRERIKLFDDSVENELNVVEDLYYEILFELEKQTSLLADKKKRCSGAYKVFYNLTKLGIKE